MYALKYITNLFCFFIVKLLTEMMEIVKIIEKTVAMNETNEAWRT